MKRISIGGREVGEGAPVLIVAELSANHGQRLDIALRTVEAAAKAGADAIKLQTYTADTLTLDSSAEPFVVKTNNQWAGRTLHDLYAEAMTPWPWHAEIKRAAEALGLLCFSTPFDVTAVEYLDALDVPAHKVASFELTDLPLVERVARSGRPVIMSTGMATFPEIEAAVAVCRQAGNDQLVLLRCVSSYPAKAESMNLASYTRLRSLGTIVGLSDHTRDATVAVASVALGAKVVEKHFIVDRAIGGPDAFFSLEPAELAALVQAVRETEAALGRESFGPTDEERGSLAFRRSLFVARDVNVGELITCDDVRSVRPSHGLSPRHLPFVLGRAAARDLKGGTPLTWADVAEAPASRVELRLATADDSESLLSWRNDALTRAMSLHQQEVSPAEHQGWLADSLVRDDRRLFIGLARGERIGVVRLDQRAHDEWEVSLTVAPEVRGKGFSGDLLRAAEVAAVAAGAVRLIARIRPDNERSLRAFKRAGYYGFATRGATLLCERRLTAYPG